MRLLLPPLSWCVFVFLSELIIWQTDAELLIMRLADVAETAPDEQERYTVW